MNHLINRLKYLWRYRDRDIGLMVHESAHVCRKSELMLPVKISGGVRIKRCRIGCRSYISRDTRMVHADMGPYCSVGPECLIGSLGRHPAAHFSTSPVTFSTKAPLCRIFGSVDEGIEFEEEAPVFIGADVWIGARAIVLDGVKIGHGAIIGANTVVTKDVPPYAIVYGSPPRVQRYRFSPEVIEVLLASQWWLSPPDKIDVKVLRMLTCYPKI
jgi:acetyltransferase-like isoleucine patch superfamily enzyme